jgi:putative ABC transport system permease protein
MRRFGWHVGQRFTLRGTADPVSLNMEVIGSLKDTAPPDPMLFRRDYLEESLNRPGMVNTFWLSAKGPQPVPLALEEIKQRFANSGAEMECEEEVVFVSNMARGSRSVIRMLQSIGYIVVVVVALIAGNTAAMSIRERAEELGVMRAMGFEKKTIFAILIGECLAIAIIGGLTGAAISQAILRALPLINASFGPFGYVTIPGSVLILCLVFFCCYRRGEWNLSRRGAITKRCHEQPAPNSVRQL